MIADSLLGLLILIIIAILFGIGFIVGYIIGQISCYGKENDERKDQGED